MRCGVGWGPTCSIYGFPAQQSHCCQFYILWWFPPFLSRSQTQIAFRHDHPPPAREYSPGEWCPLERFPPCVGNSRGTGHSAQTSDASSFSNFRPGIEAVMSGFVISRSLGLRYTATSTTNYTRVPQLNRMPLWDGSLYPWNRKTLNHQGFFIIKKTWDNFYLLTLQTTAMEGKY